MVAVVVEGKERRGGHALPIRTSLETSPSVLVRENTRASTEQRPLAVEAVQRGQIYRELPDKLISSLGVRMDSGRDTRSGRPPINPAGTEYNSDFSITVLGSWIGWERGVQHIAWSKAQIWATEVS